MSKIIVRQAVGEVVAINQQGIARTINIGDELVVGETLLTNANGEVILAFNDLQLSVGNNEQIAISPQWLADLEPVETTVSPESAENILALLDGDGDLLAELEATAAGGADTTANSGSSFVRLTRIAEATEPASLSPQFFEASVDDTDEQAAAVIDNATAVVDDSGTTNEDGSVTIDVLANDTDADGPKSPVVSVTQGANGTVTINADGTVTYTPNANFNGSDSFTYTNAEGATATVNVTVNPVNDATVVADDSATTNEDTAVVIDVLANDTDADGPKSPVVSVTQGANGTVTINADGTVTYTPNANFNGSDSFTYTNAEGATATVNVTVNPVTDATVVADDSATTNEDTAVVIDVLANDTDADGPKSPVVSVTQGANGTVTINADGTVTYTPNANFNGSDSFTYTNAEGATATVNVTVNPVTDATVVADDSATTNEDTAVVIDVLANDTDADGPKSPVVSVTQGANGTVTINADGTVTYTPNANFNGSDSFTYTNAEGATATVNVTVNPVNDATVVADDSATTNEDTAVVIDVLANDTDADGPKSPVVSVTQGANGTVTINADGTVTYTPNANFNGSDSFTYTNAEGATATVNVTVNPVTDATVVADDSATTNEDTAVVIDVLANDTDADGPKSPVVSVTQGANGTVTINADGTVTYTPNANFNGSDSFTYTNAEGATATVNVTVNPVTDATVVADDSATTNEDTAVVIDVLANDTDADGPKSPVVSVTQGANGTVTINADGTVTYTPNANFNGSDSFTYTNAEGATATVNVTVNPVNDATVVADDSATTNEDTAVVIDVLANDTDADGPKSPVVSVTQGANGTVTINADGTVTYTPNANFNGSDSFTYTNAEGATATVNVTVNPVTDATVVADDSATTNEDTAVVIDVLANDTDADGPKSPVVSVTQGANGTVTINADGTVTYTPNANFNGSDSFTYTNAEGATATVNVTVNPVNDATVVADDSATTNEDTAVVIDVLANDTDADGPKSPVVSVTQGANGTVTINADGTVTYTPNANFNGSDSFTYTNAEGATATVNVTVNPVTDATVVADDSATTNEDTAVVIDVLANDTDADGPKSPVVSVTQGANGTVTINADGTVTYTPNANFNGSDSFTYTNAEGATATVNVTVNPVNDATVVADDSATTNEDTAVVIDVLANDTDADGPKSPVVSVTQGANGTVTINADGTVTYTPNANFNGSDSFTYTNAEGATATVNVTVNPVTDATVVADDSATTNEDTAVVIDVLANDTDADGPKSPVVSVTQGANGTVTINADGTVTYTPNANFNGSDSFTYTNAEGATATVNVTVNPVTDATVVADDSATTNEDTAVVIDVLANDTDADGPKSPVVSVTQGANGTVTINADGTVTYTPNANFSGSDSFTYTNAEGATATVNVTVNPLNDAPVGTDKTITIAEDNGYALNAADFGFSDVDIGDSLQSVRIDSLPTAGILQLNGVAVTVGQVISVASLDNLTFSPTPDASGDNYASFDFSVSDQAGQFSFASNTISFNVTPVTDVPIVTVDVGAGIVSSTTITTANVTSTGQGFKVSAFNLDGSPSAISMNGNPEGFGVAGNASGANSEIGELNGQSERIVVDFDAPVTSVDVTFAWLHSGERASYTLYDSEGNIIGSGTVVGVTDRIDPTITLSSSGAAISRIEFSVPTDNASTGDDYLIHSIGFAGKTTYPLTITATPTDVDYSESITSITVRVPEGASLSVGTNNGDGTWTLPLTSSGSYSVVVDATTKAVTITGLEMTLSGNVSGTPNVTVIATAQDGGGLPQTNISDSASSTLTSSDSNDSIDGRTGIDTISGKVVNEILREGIGSDILSEGGDVFAWHLDDQGISSSTTVDRIADVNLAQGEVLNVADLLQVETVDTVNQYLSVNFTAGNTTSNISQNGSGSVTQQIALEGVDLTALGSDSQAIINALINNGNLKIE